MSLVRSKQITLNSTYSISTAHIKYVSLFCYQLHNFTSLLHQHFQFNKSKIRTISTCSRYCILFVSLSIIYMFHILLMVPPFSFLLILESLAFMLSLYSISQFLSFFFFSSPMLPSLEFRS